jgi:hypothetical protein
VGGEEEAAAAAAAAGGEAWGVPRNEGGGGGGGGGDEDEEEGEEGAADWGAGFDDPEQHHTAFSPRDSAVQPSLEQLEKELAELTAEALSAAAGARLMGSTKE